MKHLPSPILLLAIFCCAIARGQQPDQAATDSVSLKADLALSDRYYTTRPDSALFFCKAGIPLAQSLGRKADEAAFYRRIATILTDTGNYDLALDYARRSLTIAQAIDSPAALIDCYITFGRAYEFKADFIKSTEYFFKSFALAEKINDHSRMARIGTNLAAHFFNQGDYKNARNNADRTIREASAAKDPLDLYKSYYILGMSHTQLGDTLSAEKDYAAAIEICQANNYFLSKAEVLSDWATIKRNYRERLSLLLQARAVYDSLSPASYDSRVNWDNLADIYMELYKSDPRQPNNLSVATDYLQKLIRKSTEANDPVTASQGLEKMAKIEAYKGNYKVAYEYINEFHKINDSIFSQDNKNKIAALASQNELDKKNLEIADQKRKSSEARKNVILLAAGLALMSLLVFLLFRINAIRKQRNAVLEQANRTKVKLFGMLTHDLRSPIASLISLLQLLRRSPASLTKDEIDERELKIGDSAATLLDNLETMLVWSKSQMQQFVVEREPVSAADLFRHLTRHFADRENVTFCCSDEDRVVLVTDRNILSTILYNLTSNAVRALGTRPDGLIEYTARRENAKVAFVVADNGPGISPELLKPLFEETTLTSAGHGLGFQIIRELATVIGCAISFEPNPGAGSRFTVLFDEPSDPFAPGQHVIS